MAKVENIKYGSEGELAILNVGAKVGKFQSNLPDDVMAVQALLKYYREEPGYEFAPFLPPLGEPNGIPEPHFNDVIKAYQKHRDEYSSSTALKVDGIVSKARGKASWGTGKLWTIVDLNDVADFIFRLRWDGNQAVGDSYFTDLTARFPQLAPIVGRDFVIRF